MPFSRISLISFVGQTFRGMLLAWFMFQLEPASRGAQPTLHLALDPANGPQLSWATQSPSPILESAEGLHSPWSSLTNVDATVDAASTTTTVRDRRPPSATRFYRLRLPDAPPVPAAGLAYDIGTPVWRDLFVDPVNGRDSADGFDGSSRSRAFQTLAAAWRSLPEGEQHQAVRLRLLAGTYVGAYLEDRQGTQAFPILIEPADGPGTVAFRPTPAGDSGSLQFLNCAYIYLQDFAIRVDGGDGLHWERCHHVLARRMQVNSRRSEGQDETVKINQSHHVYLEDCDIADAGDNCVDVVAVQYGHIVRCKIHNSTDWGAYLKGGSAYWVIEGNEIYDCGTGGFTAGQGTGFQFMVPPWIHYETYDIKVLNNFIHDCEGAGLGVNGGFNVLLAHNTLYRVGSRSHLVEFVHGRRGCDGNDVAACQPLLDAGGWGSTGEEEQFIPNRHVQFVNNVVFNPPGFRSEYQHFQIAGPVVPPAGSNVAAPALADDDLILRGNVIVNGPEDFPLGMEEEGAGCQEGGCALAQVRAENFINAWAPSFVNAAGGDLRPTPDGVLASLTTVPAADFAWIDAPMRPAVPAGTIRNAVERDYTGRPRPADSPPGAWLP